MTTSDYALITSIASILISLGALFWNIWQKFLFVKPALQVSLSIMQVYEGTDRGTLAPTGPKLLNLSVANLGPGPAIIYACIVKPRTGRWKKSYRLGVLNPIHGDPTAPIPVSRGPFSDGLPFKIDLGEAKSFHFPYNRDCFLKEDVARVGINDTYQRNIWCSRQDMRKVMEAFLRDFPPSHPSPSSG